MFKRREPAEDIRDNSDYQRDVVNKQRLNTILKGSKLRGDITVSCDLELSGEVEGNITCEQDSNIVIKGVCKGNIMTNEGNATIEGELNNGDIIAGGDIAVTGKFNGGNAKAKGKISINGEFNGRVEGNEIEIGPSAKGKGELFYKEYISISKGAKIEAQISLIQKEIDVKKKTAELKVINMEFPIKEARTEK